MHNREKQEIKTVRIVKRESERRQRDRGDRTGNIGIPLTNGLQAPGGAKRLCDDDLGGSQKFEVNRYTAVIFAAQSKCIDSCVPISRKLNWAGWWRNRRSFTLRARFNCPSWTTFSSKEACPYRVVSAGKNSIPGRTTDRWCLRLAATACTR